MAITHNPFVTMLLANKGLFIELISANNGRIYLYNIVQFMIK